MRYVSVRVTDDGGRPAHSARVNVYIYQALANGSKEKYTDSSGLAEFELDVDDFAEISVSVNGTEKYRRGSIRGEYRFTI